VRIEGGGHDGARYVVGEGDGGAAPFSLSIIFGRPPLAEYVPNLVDFHFPCLTMIQFFLSSTLFIRYMCGNC